MTILPQTTCCTMLGIDPKTLRNWLRHANMQFSVHPTDARLKCLTLEQVQQLAAIHARPLQSPPPAPFQESEAQLALGGSATPSSSAGETDLRRAFASLEAKVTTMQEQLAQLALELLRERELRYEQRLSSLEALLSQMGSLPLSRQEPEVANIAAVSDISTHPERRLLPAELRARSRLTPLIEYGAAGAYVTICPREGELSLSPDSPEWFDWLASLTSFRFVGQLGRFTAYRDSDHGQRTRSWRAHRYIHGRNYKCYMGTTDHLTVAHLEQMAATLHAHITAL
ncbi:hypothetical protein KSC_026570 [Ktedonobacter sp. SOSP1-52]|uniref:hypothetical protein n=1 Tax=Ktedonobacter sp. SOSP1-52 TaxID=2778366 RepID=UPI00191500EC|nr:hypothetical protein [Ktedonobacter sp. SOSP1-52]GHO63765.1 hypothetical protein KSC_026570 [Ktedonobacter sp. SOSP1-52]